MQALAEAIKTFLAADLTVQANLGTLDGGPAIVTRRPVPQAANKPVALVITTSRDVPSDLVGASTGRDITRDIIVYGTHGQWDKVDAAAERIRTILHRKRLAVPSWQTVMALASGPVDAPSDLGDVARLVNVRFLLLNLQSGAA